jgi:hypothetical protein
MVVHLEAKTTFLQFSSREIYKRSSYFSSLEILNRQADRQTCSFVIFQIEPIYFCIIRTFIFSTSSRNNRWKGIKNLWAVRFGLEKQKSAAIINVAGLFACFLLSETKCNKSIARCALWRACVQIENNCIVKMLLTFCGCSF